MLEHVFQMTGRRLQPMMVWPEKPPFTARWTDFPFTVWKGHKHVTLPQRKVWS